MQNWPKCPPDLTRRTVPRLNAALSRWRTAGPAPAGAAVRIGVVTSRLTPLGMPVIRPDPHCCDPRSPVHQRQNPSKRLARFSRVPWLRPKRQAKRPDKCCPREAHRGLHSPPGSRTSSDLRSRRRFGLPEIAPAFFKLRDSRSAGPQQLQIAPRAARSAGVSPRPISRAPRCRATQSRIDSRTAN